jgi:hypothetical protein
MIIRLQFNYKYINIFYTIQNHYKPDTQKRNLVTLINCLLALIL